MRALGIIALLVVPLPAQTVGGSASRTVSVIAEEAHVDVSVIASREVPLDVLLRSLAPTGIGREHLTSVSLTLDADRIAPGGPGGPLAPVMAYTYGFFFAAAPAGISQMIERFQEFGRTLAPGVISWSTTGSLSASDAAFEVSRIAQLPALFADARRRADQWRQASGISQSTVVFLSDSIAPRGATQLLALQPTVAIARGTTAAFSVNLRMGQGPRLVSATASKLVTLAPEETTFRVLVTAQPNVTSDQIVEMLAPAGFAAGDLQSVDSRGVDSRQELPPGVPPFPVPVQPSTAAFDLMSVQSVEQTDAILRALDQLQRTPRPGILSIQFGAGMRVSPGTIDLLFRNVMPELLQQTRRKAGDLAQAMSGRLGNLISFSEGPLELGNGLSFGQQTFVPSNLRILTTVSAQYAVE